MIKIICSAIYYDDGKKREYMPKNIERGIVVCGRRHHNCFRILLEIFKHYPLSVVQGFLTTDDRFVTREEAFYIARNAGQLINNCTETHVLTSEDLWMTPEEEPWKTK